MSIAVVDLFAGPGGLAEGFESVGYFQPTYSGMFDVACSFEKDEHAARTLRLRGLYRALLEGNRSEAYFAAVDQWSRGGIDPDEMLAGTYPDLMETASRRVFCEALGHTNREAVARAVRRAVAGRRWVLVGGPPCQAYSIVGRSRNAGNPAYDASADERQTLYEEYLNLLAVGQPDAFVLENVVGLLSATVDNRRIFSRMIADLSQPQRAVSARRSGVKYRLFSLVTGHELPVPVQGHRGSTTLDPLPEDHMRSTVVRMEKYGVPQARHRVILLGVRADLMDPGTSSIRGLVPATGVGSAAGHVLWDIPALRSRISGGGDGREEWRELIHSAPLHEWTPNLRPALNGHSGSVLQSLVHRIHNARVPQAGVGGRVVVPVGRARRNESGLPEHIRQDAIAQWDAIWKRWYRGDVPHVGFGYPNHESRSHMAADLYRYLFAATFGWLSGNRSPRLREFPESLHPQHRNLRKALETGHFGDRFKVQLAGQAARTVTSHIHKDGHYFIHFDPAQMRSLTVREAARLQTFPDSYVFLGPRTEQFRQVGNAVPPYFAAQVAAVVARLLDDSS